MAFCSEIVCDGCGVSISIMRIATKGEMIRLARSDGWSVGKWELCPDCRRKKAELLKNGWIK